MTRATKVAALAALALILSSPLASAQQATVMGLDSNGMPKKIGASSDRLKVESSTQTFTSTTGPTEYCMVSTAGGTTVSLPAGTKWVKIQNTGPNPISCTFDNFAPVAGTTGLKVQALTAGDLTTPADSTGWIPVAANTVVKCIAATATQVTGACSRVLTIQ